MRILIAPQEFKGSLTARTAAEAMARGLQRSLPEADLDVLPMADGGPGTLDVLVEATNGRMVETVVRGPMGEPVRARWGALADGWTAVVEMAEASGLVRVPEAERDPRRASTYGTGELLRAALDEGYRRIIVGVGGSATNDGGAGLAQALGVRLLDGDGLELPPGGAALARLQRINAAQSDARLRESEVIVAADVTNLLCGPGGASLVYGAQKGASDAVARELDAALAHFADVVRRDLGIDKANESGAGAAGGLAYGLLVFCNATLRPGFEVVAEATSFAEHVANADLVVTGEGRLDRQTAFGKTTAGVARAARAAGKPVVAIVGSTQDGGEPSLFDGVFALTDYASADEAVSRAGELVERAAEAAGRWWQEEHSS